jgi:hypothetical protein
MGSSILKVLMHQGGQREVADWEGGHRVSVHPFIWKKILEVTLKFRRNIL